MKEFTYRVPWADRDSYIFMPACAYNGNRFRSLRKWYPPSFEEGEAGVDFPITITDIPRLREDGSGWIEVTSGDLSVPCVGVYAPQKKKALLLYTVQQLDGENIGLAYGEGTIRLTSPARRELVYRWPFMEPGNAASPADAEETEFPHRVLEFGCSSFAEFFARFFESRKCMGMDSARAEEMPLRRQMELLLKKYDGSWSPNWGYSRDDCHWAPGWCETADSYALMKMGDERIFRRAQKTFDFLFRTQTKLGFFAEGAVCEDGKITVSGKRHFIRRSADALYLAFKVFDLFQERDLPLPEGYAEGAKRCADALIALFDRYGQLGQFIDAETGEILVGGSGCAGAAPAALCCAAEFFGEKRYLEYARRIADYFCENFLDRGYTVGGPAEILQTPDSESAFLLLESLVKLAETTRKKADIRRAEFAAQFCSSWVVAYNYTFPPKSECGRLGIRTTGAVFANCQNKHAAPGIATLSGDSLARLAHLTGDGRYLELLGDISSAISQCMSTADRPIYSWDVPMNATHYRGEIPVVPREALPEGWINERINMSDWETERCVGGVFYGSCWPEASLLLTLAEIRGCRYDETYALR